MLLDIFLPTVNALKIVPCKKGNKEQNVNKRNRKKLPNLKALSHNFYGKND